MTAIVVVVLVVWFNLIASVSGTCRVVCTRLPGTKLRFILVLVHFVGVCESILLKISRRRPLCRRNFIYLRHFFFKHSRQNAEK